MVNWNVPLMFTTTPDMCGGVAPTVMLVKAKASAGLGSGVAALTVAELKKLPALLACIVSVACPPALVALVASTSIFQITVDPLRVMEPTVLLLETSEKPEGIESDTCTLVEADGP